MKAMIFAAGLGTRLKPITDTLPKALVPVCGKPLLEHVLRKLMSYGVTEAVVNVHHFADKIQTWVAEQEWIVSSPEELSDGRILVFLSDERKLLLETGGAVLKARGFLEGSGHFLIHNVDILSDCDFDWFAAHVKEDAAATLLVSQRPTSRYFLFHPDSMKLVGWKNIKTGECIISDSSLAMEDCRACAFSGIHIMSDRIFVLMDEYIKETGIPVDESVGTRFPVKDFYLWAAARADIYGVFSENLSLLDVGKLDAIAPAEAFISSQI